VHACYPLSLSLPPSGSVLPLSHFIFSLSFNLLWCIRERNTWIKKNSSSEKKERKRNTPFIQFLESGIWILEWPPFSSTFIILFSNHLILFNHFVVPLPLQGPPGPEIHVRLQFIFILIVTNSNANMLLIIYYTWTFCSFSMCYFFFFSRFNVFCCSRRYDFCMKILYYVPQ